MGQMQNTLEALLKERGRVVHKELSFPKRTDISGAGLLSAVTEIYHQLGGVLDEFELNLRSWDMEYEGVAVELDEYLHFNRYRLNSLTSSLYARLFGFPTVEYAEYCRVRENKCLSAGSYGGKWSSNSTERQFGPAGPKKELGGAGSPRWKQRAFYDFVKDLSPVLIGVRVARVAVWDKIWENGQERTIEEVLKSPSDSSAEGITKLIQARIA